MCKIDGVIKILSLEEAFNIWKSKTFESFEVLTVDDRGKTNFSRVKDVVDHGLLEAYEIDLFGGRKLTVSGDHSLIIMKDEKFIEIKASELCKDDTLITFCNKTDPYKDSPYIIKKYNYITKKHLVKNKYINNEKKKF